MLNSICNDYIEVIVKDFGAVLTGIKSKRSGHEFLWQGNPEIWNGQSPILFPIIGRLYNDSYSLNGKEYSIIRHGFARHNAFDLFSQACDELVFVQHESEDTLNVFPYQFKLGVFFKIEDNKLTVTHKVKNRNEDKMYFSIGAHPAFNCELGDKIVFEKKENKFCERISEDSLLIDEKDLILDNSDTIVLEKGLFSKDAMIFEALESNYCTLVRQNGVKIKFTFGSAPFFAVWSKPNAPFVCLEPWYGINDAHNKTEDFSQKRGIICLEPRQKFEFSWSAEFIE